MINQKFRIFFNRFELFSYCIHKVSLRSSDETPIKRKRPSHTPDITPLITYQRKYKINAHTPEE